MTNEELLAFDAKIRAEHARSVECLAACSGVTGVDGPIPAGAFRRVVEALREFAQDANWRRGSLCDPNGPRFDGQHIALEALNGLSLTDTKGDG